MQPSRGATVALRMGCVSVRRYAHRLVATTRRRWPEVVARRAGTLARRAGRARAQASVSDARSLYREDRDPSLRSGW